jgi:N-acetylneuraminic acid mutarotase
MYKIYTLIIVAIASTLAMNAQSWVQAADFIGNPPERHHPVTFSINGYGYMATGVDANNLLYRDFYKYDPSADSWEKLPDFPGAARGLAYGDTASGKAYLGFGVGQQYFNDLWEFDPETEQWRELTPCPCEGRTHPAFVAEGDYIVVGFGNDQSGNKNDFWQYQISTDTWEEIADPVGNNRHHPFYFGIDGDVYVGLGHGSVQEVWNGLTTPIYRDWHKWTPGVSTEWTKMQDFPGEPRVAGQQTAFRGKGYVVSGQGYDHQNFDRGEFWEYDPQTDSWSELPPHPGTGRWAPGSFLLQGRLYIVGGRAHIGSNKQNFDLRKDMWYVNLVPSSVDEDRVASAGVWPNPASDVFSFGSGIELVSYTITDMNGKTVIGSDSGMFSDVNISGLSAGQYIVTAKDVSGDTYQDILIKR